MWEVIVGLLSLGTVIFIVGMQASRSDARMKKSGESPTETRKGPNADRDTHKPEFAAVGAGQRESGGDQADRMASAGH